MIYPSFAYFFLLILLSLIALMKIMRNPLATDIPNTPAFQKAFVQHIVSKWGNSATTGTWYQLDNEVSNWAYPSSFPFSPLLTSPPLPLFLICWLFCLLSLFLGHALTTHRYMHRDVHPQPVTQAEIVNQTIVSLFSSFISSPFIINIVCFLLPRPLLYYSSDH